MERCNPKTQATVSARFSQVGRCTLSVIAPTVLYRRVRAETCFHALELDKARSSQSLRECLNIVAQ